jgi:hypothetical protein
MSSRSVRKFARLTMQAIALDWPNLISRIPDAARSIPARTPVTASTVVKWLQGCTKPSGDNVAILFAEFDEFADAFKERMNRKDPGLTHEQRAALLRAIGEQ